LLHHAAEVLAVQAAPVNLAHVALRAQDGEVREVEDGRADLHAAVGGRPLEPHLELQLEIAVRALAAQEGVELQALRRGADDGPVLDAPVLHEAIPAGQVFAVEEAAWGIRAAGGGAPREGRDAGGPGHQADRTRNRSPEW